MKERMIQLVTTKYTGMDYKDAYVTSKYFDFQKEFSKIFLQHLDRDYNLLAGNEDSQANISISF